MKMGIALPNTYSHYPRQFVQSFFCLQRPESAVLLTPNCDGPIDSVRNELCQQALLHECTHIFWCDTDQVYSPDVMPRLINWKLPIVCAKVHRRKPPFDPLLKRVNPDEEDKENPYIDVDIDEWAYNLNDSPDYPLVEVDATGFGCNLISIEVIEKMERPWFQFDLYSKPTVGEDIYFWRKAKDLGFKIFVDCSIQIGHLGTVNVDQQTYFAYRKSMGQDRWGLGSDKAVLGGPLFPPSH